MKNIINSLLAFVLLTVAGCKEPKEENKVIPGSPTLTTAQAQNVTSNSAFLGGSITAEGACSVATSGVVLATSPSPTTSDITLPNVPTVGTGNFTVSATGLIPATKYYARAYAINCKGINYGNEITFTTLVGGGGGGGGSDTAYFSLTVDGVTYAAPDLMGPNTGRIYPEGSTRFASVTLDASTGEFGIIAQASSLFDDSKTSGFGFNLIYKPLSSQGTFTFSGVADASKSANIQIRTGAGSFDPLSNIYLYDPSNSTRSKSGSNCTGTDKASATNTLNITTWGNQGEFVIGTATGTLYENARAEFNCTNSVAHPFSVSFKLKRVQ